MFLLKLFICFSINQSAFAAILTAVKSMDDTSQKQIAEAIDSFNQGVLLESQNKLSEALSEYDQAILKNPNMFKAHVNRAGALDRMGQYQAALNAVDKGLQLNSRDEIGWVVRSNIHFNLKDYEAAIKDAEQCLKIKPLIGCYCKKGHALERMSKYKEAREVYDVGLLKYPNAKDLMHNRMIESFKLLDFQAAKKDFDAFKKRHPKDKRLPLFEDLLNDYQKSVEHKNK